MSANQAAACVEPSEIQDMAREGRSFFGELLRILR